MRTLLNFVLLIAVLALGVALVERHLFPCYQPLTYEVGSVDAQFDISREELIEIAQDAEHLWEDALGRDLLSYEPEGGEVEVSLVFDERQRDTLQAREFETTLDSQGREIESVEEQYEALAREYREAEERFLQNVEQYNARRSAFSDRAEAWNASDRTDEDELAALQEEERELENMQTELRREEAELDAMSDRLETVLDNRNQLASQYNTNVETYNERFSGSRTFDQGQYSSSNTEITIYQYDDEVDLTLVLAHEFGHALGVGHVDDPSSVMHRLMREQFVDPIRLTEADIDAVRSACRF